MVRAFAHGAMGHRIIPFSGELDVACGKSIHSWCDGLSDRSYRVDPFSYFSVHPVLHDWCSKGGGMCYPVYWIVHINNPCC